MASRNRALVRVAVPTAVAVALLLAWEISGSAANPDHIRVIPAPSDILGALWNNRTRLWADLQRTALAATLGFALGAALAVVTSIAFLRNRTVESALFSVALTIGSLPLIALVPILVAWFGNGLTPKVILAALICYFPMLANTTKGLKAVPEGQLELMRVLDAGWWQVFFKVRVLSAFPFVLAGMRIGAPAAVLGAILGEWVSTETGLGSRLLVALANFNPPLLWATMLVTTFLTLLAFGLFVLTEVLMRKQRETGRLLRRPPRQLTTAED